MTGKDAGSIRVRQGGGRMNVFRWVALLIVTGVPAIASGAGLAHNQNFIVLAPDQLLADEVLAKAGDYRSQIAAQLFGKPLRAGAGRAIINVEICGGGDSAFTWPIDSPERKYHKVWLKTSAAAAAGNTLRHEMVHVLLNTKYPQQLPMWLEEGLAGRNDDPERLDIRRRLLASYATGGHWPDLKAIVDREIIDADDQAAYSVAGSLTEYLLTRGDMATLLRFGIAQKASGWNTALEQYYHIASLRQLQESWRAWVGEAASAATP
jgi:hypothetical protein